MDLLPSRQWRQRVAALQRQWQRQWLPWAGYSWTLTTGWDISMKQFPEEKDFVLTIMPVALVSSSNLPCKLGKWFTRHEPSFGYRGRYPQPSKVTVGSASTGPLLLLVGCPDKVIEFYWNICAWVPLWFHAALSPRIAGTGNWQLWWEEGCWVGHIWGGCGNLGAIVFRFVAIKLAQAPHAGEKWHFWGPRGESELCHM